MESTTINRNEIITLILADMRSRKLIMGLEAMGLYTDDFKTNLSELIFSKMQISKQQEVQVGTWYEDTIHDLLNTDLNKFKMNQLFFAILLYDTLEEKKNSIQVETLVKNEKNKFPFLKWVCGWKRDN